MTWFFGVYLDLGIEWVQAKLWGLFGEVCLEVGRWPLFGWLLATGWLVDPINPASRPGWYG